MAKLKIERAFGMAPNDLLYSREISMSAKGLYTFIYAKPDGFNFSIDRIASEIKEGRKAINNALRELEEYGWLVRRKFKNEKGQWDVEYTLHSKANQCPSRVDGEGTEKKQNQCPSRVDGEGSNNKNKTKNKNNTSNEVLLSSQQNCEDRTSKKEKDFSLKNSETDSEINSEGQIENQASETVPQKKSSAVASDSFSAIRNTEISGTPKTTSPELAERRVKLLEFFRKSVGLDKFKDYSEWQEVGRMENLIQKIGRDEFLMRMKTILEDNYLLRKCNYLSFLRKEIESFIHSPQFEPTLSHKPSRVG